MQRLKDAAELQKYLIEKGYLNIEFCDIEEDGIINIHHYSLSMNTEIAKSHGCLLYEAIDLKSDRALEVLKQWINKTKIYPDPRSL